MLPFGVKIGERIEEFLIRNLRCSQMMESGVIVA